MLDVGHITAGYGGPPVVRDVSFAVPPGGRLCILGPNGCGKTTLLRAVAGLLPHGGQVTVGGQALETLPPRQRARHIALMSQLAGAGFAYTVYETVMLGRYAHQPAGLWETVTEADRRAVRESLECTGTWALRGRAVTELSGGQWQRVLLARAFAQEPRVLLLDEPTNHLDLRYQVELVGAVKDWAAQAPRCVVAVLHDINLALAFADTVLLMENGAVRACAPVQDFDLRQLDAVYGLDVRAYMQSSLRRWAAP